MVMMRLSISRRIYRHSWAMRDNSDEQFRMLYDMINHDGPIGFVSNTGREAPNKLEADQP